MTSPYSLLSITKKYELQNEGGYIHFTEADEILPVRIISKGIFHQ